MSSETGCFFLFHLYDWVFLLHLFLISVVIVCPDVPLLSSGHGRADVPPSSNLAPACHAHTGIRPPLHN